MKAPQILINEAEDKAAEWQMAKAMAASKHRQLRGNNVRPISNRDLCHRYQRQRPL
jgi:hypothetical protein